MPDNDRGRWTTIDRTVQRRTPTGALEQVPVTDAIIERVRMGAPTKHAAISAGVALSTLYLWLTTARAARAMLDLDDRYPASDYERSCMDLLERMEVAKGEFVVAALGRVQQAANGGLTSRKTVTTTVMRNGVAEVTTTVTEEVSAPAWTANAWLLERTHPEDFGRWSRTEVTGAGGGPIEVETNDRAAALGASIRGVLERRAAIEAEAEDVGTVDPEGLTVDDEPV